jgi:hypothetical protein
MDIPTSLVGEMGLVEDAAISADWFSRELRSSGYVADFLPASLWEADRFFSENFRSGVPTRRGRRRVGSLIDPTGRVYGFAFGAYVGEAIRRALGGEWAADDSDVNGEVNIELRLPTGVVISPVMRCAQRMARGPGDSIAAYAEHLGLNVGRAAKGSAQVRTRSRARGARPPLADVCRVNSPSGLPATHRACHSRISVSRHRSLRQLLGLARFAA